MEFPDFLLRLRGFFGILARKQLFSIPFKYFFPLLDLVGMDLITAGKNRYRFLLLRSRKGNLRLEGFPESVISSFQFWPDFIFSLFPAFRLFLSKKMA